PEGGSQAFADDLARILEASGGDILMHSRAARVVVENGAATGVEIETGLGTRRHTVRVSAPNIVSNADLVLTLEQMLGPDVVGAELIAAVKRLRPSFPCFLTHIGLRDFPLDPLVNASGYHWRSWDPDRVADDAFKIFVPTMYEPKMAPPGG